MFMLITENKVNILDIIWKKAKSDPYLDHVTTVTGSSLSRFLKTSIVGQIVISLLVNQKTLAKPNYVLKIKRCLEIDKNAIDLNILKASVNADHIIDLFLIVLENHLDLNPGL